jgi:methyl-accepting chemotaxis protein
LRQVPALHGHSPELSGIVARAQGQGGHGCLHGQHRPLQQLFDDLLKLVDLNSAGGKKANETADSTYDSARMLFFVITGLSLLVGTAAAVIVVRSVMKQLGGEPDYACDIISQIAMAT